MKKVLITGGSGFIGTRLTALLKKHRYEVVHLTRERNSRSGVRTYLWDFKNNYLEAGALENVDFIVHLAGEGITDKRWTEERKKSIVNSRTKTIEFLYRKLDEKNIVPQAVISASGISIYGTATTDNIYMETDAPGEDFVADCTVQWEKSVNLFSEKTRVAMLRTGFVLDKNEGGLPKMALPIRFGFGAALGSGKQWLPWIHIDDICRMYLHAIQNENVKGPYNAIAPQHINNKEMTKAIAKAVRMPLILPNIPSWLLKLFLGEMAVLVLEGSRASADKIIQSGFEFEYPEIHKALIQIYK